jgi:hypothetical protein
MADEQNEDKKAKQQEQIGKVEQLQDLLLDDWIAAIKDKRATATDRATIARFLVQQGWSVDPSQIPQELRDVLTSRRRFDEDLSDDETGARALRVV